MSKLALLFDADYYAFSAASAVQKNIEWEDGIIESYGDLNEAKQIFVNAIEQIASKRRSWSVAKHVMCFTDTVNWRKEVLETYKANRSGKPVVYYALKKWIMENYECFERHTLEGDDCMGIISTKPSIVGCDHAIIVSPDKDFNTIPGEFLWVDVHGGKSELKVVTEAEADHWHMLQTLMGDTTDNYTGCPGLGKKSAMDFLEEPYVAFQEERELKSGPRKGELVTEWKKRPLGPEDTLWSAIVSLFVKAGLDEEYALVQARVARILRASDFNFATKEVILWSPT